MPFSVDHKIWLWLAPVLVIAAVLGRILWVLRGSAHWPTADGTITTLDVQRKRDAGIDGGHYVSALFTYQFRDLEGNLQSGTWYKNFSDERAAREFAAREMPLEKQVQVRFNPEDPSTSYLELDSFAYTDDRPTSLGL